MTIKINLKNTFFFSQPIKLICFHNGRIRFYAEPCTLMIFGIKEINKKPKCFFVITTHSHATVLTTTLTELKTKFPSRFRKDRQ